MIAVPLPYPWSEKKPGSFSGTAGFAFFFSANVLTSFHLINFNVKFDLLVIFRAGTPPLACPAHARDAVVLVWREYKFSEIAPRTRAGHEGLGRCRSLDVQLDRLVCEAVPSRRFGELVAGRAEEGVVGVGLPHQPPLE